MTPITADTLVVISKGCAAKRLTRGTRARVCEVEPLGRDYSYSVRVRLFIQNGTRAGDFVNLYARHVNRLSDVVVNLNDGNPLHLVKIMRKV